MHVRDVPRLYQAGGLELAARRIVEGLYGGRHRSPYTGAATEFHDHRPYLPGDDLRQVDWKAFARSDHLLIRRFREERDLPVVLLVDRSASMDYGSPSKRDWGDLAAATLGLLAIEQGDRVRLVIGSSELSHIGPERGGPAAAGALCHELERQGPAGAGELPALLTQLGGRLDRKTLIVVISDLLVDADALRKPLGGLHARGHDIVALQVLDRSELALPAEWGPSTLVDPEGRVPAFSCDAEATKAPYDAAMAAHLAACRRAIAACRGDLVLGATDGDVAQILGNWLHRRCRGPGGR